MNIARSSGFTVIALWERRSPFFKGLFLFPALFANYKKKQKLHNLTSSDVTEQVIKGNVAIIKHTDDGETQIETPENGATFEVYLKSAGSYDAADEDEKDSINSFELVRWGR